MEHEARGSTSATHAPADFQAEIERGFGKHDFWPAQAVRIWRPSSRPGRGLVLLAVALGAAIAVLSVIQLFTMWFGPCLHGAC